MKYFESLYVYQVRVQEFLPAATLFLYAHVSQLIAQHGDAVKLAVRACPEASGESLGEIGSRGLVNCVAAWGPWLRVLYQGYKASLGIRESTWWCG